MAAEWSATRPEWGGPAPAVAPTEVVRLQGPLPAPLQAEWRSLARRLQETSYFQSPDWVLGWWETLGGLPPSECATWRDRSGSLEAVAMLSRRPERLHRRLPIAVPTWAVAGSGPGAADHVGFPSLARRRPDVWRWLASRTHGASLILRNLDPVAEPVLLPPGARLLERSACPRVDLSPDDGAAGGSAKLRKQLRGYERRLEREGVRFRWLGPAMMNEDTVNLLFRLHERRRQLKDAPSSLLPGQRVLHQRLVATAKEYGDGTGPAAIVADYRDDPIGILYGFSWNGVFSYYQTGWDPAWSQLSLGTVLVSQAMQLSRDHGASIFDFLRGADAYKYRFGATDRFDETWIVPGGWSGRALDLKYRTKDWLATRAVPASSG